LKVDSQRRNAGAEGKSRKRADLPGGISDRRRYLRGTTVGTGFSNDRV